MIDLEGGVSRPRDVSRTEATALKQLYSVRLARSRQC